MIDYLFCFNCVIVCYYCVGASGICCGLLCVVWFIRLFVCVNMLWWLLRLCFDSLLCICFV